MRFMFEDKNKESVSDKLDLCAPIPQIYTTAVALYGIALVKHASQVLSASCETASQQDRHLIR
jgi:hypothetical protein